MKFKHFYLTEIKDIEQIEHDTETFDFARCDGIPYRLSGKNEKIVSVDEVSFTKGNVFYKTRVDDYVEYIKDGGIIDSFPVKQYSLANNLYDMCSFLYEHNGLGDFYDKESEKEIFNISKILESKLPDLTDMFDSKSEHFIEGLNKNARNIKDLGIEENKDDFELIFDFFDDHKEYVLMEMNHRFKAVKQLDVDSVYIDIENK